MTSGRAGGRPARSGGKALDREEAARRTLLGRLLSAIGPRATPAMPPRELRRILIVQLQQVGDTVIFAPALRAIRERYPAARIEVLAHRVGAQLYRSCPLVDEVIEEHGWGTRRLHLLSLRTLRLLRARGYDAVVTDVTESAFAYTLLAWLVGAPVRVGFDRGSRGALHTVQVPYDESRGFLHSNLEIARALGADVGDPREGVFVGEADRAHARSVLSRHGVLGARPLVVVHPATNWESKLWFEDRWAAVADALVEKHGASILFVGTAAEGPYVERVRARMRRPARSSAGETDLPQLAALLEHADLFLGTDSGPRHLAGALGRPQVTIFSAQDYPNRWSLDRPGEIRLRTAPECSPCLSATCPRGDRLCMELIATAEVLAACDRHLERGNHRPTDRPAREPGAVGAGM